MCAVATPRGRPQPARAWLRAPRPCRRWVAPATTNARRRLWRSRPGAPPRRVCTTVAGGGSATHMEDAVRLQNLLPSALKARWSAAPATPDLASVRAAELRTILRKDARADPAAVEAG